MKRSSRAFLSLLLVLSLCLGMMPMSIFADEGTPAEPDAEPSAVENVLDAEGGEEGDSAVLDEPAAPAAGEEAGEEAKTEEPAADETKKVNEPLVEVKEEAAPVADEKKAEEGDEELKLDEAKILDVQEGAKLEVLEKAPAEDAAQKGEMLEKAPAEEKKIDDSADDVNSEEEPAPAVEVAVNAVKAVAGYNGYYASFHYDYTANDGTVYSYVYPNYHDDGGSLGMTIPDDGHVSPPSFSFISRRLQSKGFPIQEEGAYIIAWKHGTDGYQAGTYNIDDNNFDFKGMSCTIFRQNHFFAVWAKSSDDVVVVTFDPGFEGGDAPVSQSIIPGENAKVKQPSNFPSGYLYYNTNHTNTYVYNGQKYYFDYWTLNGEKYDFNTVIEAGTEDFTLVAKWHKRCDITFVTNVEGVTVDPKVVDEGKTITQPSVKNPGHELKYWYYLDGEDKVVFDFENTAVTENLTLYAEWIDVDTVKYCMVSPGGFASGESYTVTYSEAKNAEEFAAGKFTVASFEETGFKAPKGWKFLGWKEVDKDPSAPMIQPGTGEWGPSDEVKKKPALNAAAKLRFRSRLADDEAEMMKEQEAEQSQAQEVDEGEEPAAVNADPIQPGEKLDLHAEVYLVPVWGKTPLVIYYTNYESVRLTEPMKDAYGFYDEYKLEDETFKVLDFDKVAWELEDGDLKKTAPVGYKFAGWTMRYSDDPDAPDEYLPNEPVIIGPVNPPPAADRSIELRSEDRAVEVRRAAMLQKSSVPEEAASPVTPTAEVLEKLIYQPGEDCDLHLRVYLDAIWESVPTITYHTNYPVDRKDEIEDRSVPTDPFKGLSEEQERPKQFEIKDLDDAELKFAVPDGYEFEGWYIVYNKPYKDVKPFNPGDVLPFWPNHPIEQLVEQVQQMDAVEYAKETLRSAPLRSSSPEEAQPGQAELKPVAVIEKEPSGTSDRLYQPEEMYDIYTRVDVYAIWLRKPAVTYFTNYERHDLKGYKESFYQDPTPYSVKDILEYSPEENASKKPVTVLGFDEIGAKNGFVEPAGYVFDHWVMKIDDRLDLRAESPVNPVFKQEAIEEDVKAEEEADEELKEKKEVLSDAVTEAKAVEAKAEKREARLVRAAKFAVLEEAVKAPVKEATEMEVIPAESETAQLIPAEAEPAAVDIMENAHYKGDKEDLHIIVDFYAIYVPAYEIEYNSNYPDALGLDVQTARDKVKKGTDDISYNVLSLDSVTKINEKFVAPTGYKFLGWSLDEPDQTEKLLNAPNDSITLKGEKPADVKPTNGKDTFDPGSVKPIDWSNLPNKIDTQTLPSTDLVSSNGTSRETEVKEAIGPFEEKAEADLADPGTIPPEQEQDPGQQAEASNVKPEHIFYAQWEKVYGVYWIDKDGSTDEPLATGTYDTYDPETFDPAAEYDKEKTDDAPATDKLTYTDEDGVTYVFDHWERIKYDEETKTVVYEAAYRPVDSEKTYTITWVDGDGNVLKTDTVKEGETPSYTGDTPTKSPNGDTTYTFNDKWSPDIVPAVADAVYTAQFDENTPNNPTTPSNPRPTTPATTEDPVEEEPSEIDENDTPLSGFEVDPEEDEPVAENDTPLAGYEEEPDEELSDEAMPFSPFTGDARHTAVWSIISVLSLLGIVLVARKRREE